MKYILQIIAAIVLILLGRFVFPEELSHHLIAEGVIVLISMMIVEFGYEIYKNWNQLGLFFLTKTIYCNKEVRLSISYLYRIKVENKYLLVKSRTRNYFQPVGGAFKTLPGSERIFEKLDVRPDKLIETEKGIAKNDLRVYVKGKNVIKFIDWFKSKEDRETSPWREFCEELISTKILDWQPFRNIDYKFKGTIQTPILKLSSGDNGLFMFEIFDLVPNDEQKPILKALLDAGDTDKILWADEILINRLGHDENNKQYTHEIGQHTKWALDLKWSK